MIITRSPLRITLGGGGTDLPSYYTRFGGSVISAAIDRYVYVTVMRPFLPGIYLKYSRQEMVESIDQVEHPIIAEVLRHLDFKTPQVEITTLADIPSGTGLGSSSSFTTALLKALYAHRRKMILPNELAELACQIEIERLRQPIGKQDQYIAAYGGITCFDFRADGTVEAHPLAVSMDTLFDLEDNLLLFFTGFDRAAGSILKDQDDRSKNDDPSMLENLHYVKELGVRSRVALESGRCSEFGEIMHEHWENKRRRSSGMSNPRIDEWYEYGRSNGAVGGKLVGAGGGGFLMFYAADRVRLRQAMNRAGLEEVRFHFDFDGTKSLL
ncbi:MAG: galactokinase [Acidobacteria bacterium]|nr:galactokinase [Acidobacteriota bacterium]